MKPKKHTRYTLIGQKGINLIERTVLDMGYVWHPRTIDAGIDGMIELRNNDTGEAYNFHILVQSKATETGFQNDNGYSFEYLCNERDIDYWLKGNAPVILICSDVRNNTAFWMNVKDYFSDSTKRKTKKVFFDKTKNAFTTECRADLISFVSNINPGVYFSPAPQKENIYSNLLPLLSFPTKIYFAKTDYRKKMELWKALNELEDKKGINKQWMLSDELIYSFNDLNTHPWNSIIKGKVESFDSSSWAYSNELAIKNKFIQLLNNTLESFLHHKGIIHKINEQVNLYYFKPRLDNSQNPVSAKMMYERFGRRAHQSICEKYARKSDPSIISFYRHLAFETRFLRFDNTWYLELTPTYYFTHDGFKLHYYYESKLKGKKALDKAPAVFSETLFWAYIITKGSGPLFKDNHSLKFNWLWRSELEAGIDDELWLKKDDVTETSFTTQLRLVLK